ncbi:MAG: metal-dependent hydrolase [Bacillota bacterium]|jgi:inner membrane protein
MDPITHIVAGIGLAALSNTPLSISNPIYLAASLGSFAPDLDLVCRTQGEISYLYRHRGASHSLLGLLTLPALAAFLLQLFYPNTGFPTLYFWAMAGNISHVLLDFFNPHGVQFLWPIKRTRYHQSLLNGFDPILLLIFIISMIGYKYGATHPLLAILGFFVYMLFRLTMSKTVHKLLIKEFAEDVSKKFIVMPSLISIWSWDFLIDNKESIIAGEVKILPKKLQVMAILHKSHERIVNIATSNKIGKMFQDFTPYFHVFPIKKESNEIYLEFIDLRYRIKNTFLHSAIAVYNENEELKKAFFYPFSKKREIKITG